MRAFQGSLHHPAQRGWSEPHLHASQLIYPLFISEKIEDVPISGFAPHMQWGNDTQYASLVTHLEPLMKSGLKSIMLFGIVVEKDVTGSRAYDTPVLSALRILRKAFPTLCIACDVCLCEYTSHGHCGILQKDTCDIINNEASIAILAEIAVIYGNAGADIVAPSDMMDNRIGSIRTALNEAHLQRVSIMAYTSKKASALYAPFRSAVDSTFTGNRARYQHPVGSTCHAAQAYDRDVHQGADSVIVKPSLFYTDLIQSFATLKKVPVVAYMVSGEYKMLMDYGTGTEDVESIVKEAHISLLRAGASVIITYFTPQLLQDWLPKW